MTRSEQMRQTHAKLHLLIEQNPEAECYKITQLMYDTKRPYGNQVAGVKKMMQVMKDGAKPQEPFVKKSSSTRVMELSEAYAVNKQFRDNLEKTRECDIMLFPVEKQKISIEINRLSEWLKEAEQTLTVRFIQT